MNSARLEPALDNPEVHDGLKVPAAFMEESIKAARKRFPNRDRETAMRDAAVHVFRAHLPKLNALFDDVEFEVSQETGTKSRGRIDLVLWMKARA